MSRLWEVQRPEKSQARSLYNFFAIPETQLTTHLGGLPGSTRVPLVSADSYLKANWSLLKPEGGEGKGGATTDVPGDDTAPPTQPLPVARGPASAFQARARPRPTPTHSPQLSGAQLPGERPGSVGSPLAGSRLPFCLSTSALGRQYGCCGCLAKRTLIRGPGAASLRQPSRSPALPPPLAPVPGAGGLLATWGRASAPGARLPVQRRSGGRRLTLPAPTSARRPSPREALGPLRQAGP